MHICMVIALCANVCRGQMSPVTIYVNGNIYTFDDSVRHAEAMAVADGKILGIGTNQDLATSIDGNTVMIDLKEKQSFPD